MAINVLVVDDSAVMRAMIIKTLRLGGIPLGEVHQAANGQEGLDALEREWIDLVLLDINMPVLRGEEMLARVRANPLTRGLPVLVVSSDRSETRREMLRELSVEFVEKPFTPEKLSEIVSSMLGISTASGARPPLGEGPDF